MDSIYRKRRYRNETVNKIYEKYIRIRKRVRTNTSALAHKGRERITFMFVPHSEKRIYNFQLSRFGLLVLMLVITAAVAFSVISLNSHESTSTRIDQLANLRQYHEGQIRAFKQRTDYTLKSYGILDHELDRLGVHLGKPLTKANIPLMGKGGMGETTFGERTNRAFCMLREIKELEHVNTNLVQETKQLARANTLILALKKTLRDVPAIWPVVGGGFLTSRYGGRPHPFTGMNHVHTGIDIAWWPGSPIKATANGVVSLVRHSVDGYGLYILIRHKYGFSTRYAHLQSARVKEGDRVQQGQIIASMGNSGMATGYHLHYEVILDEIPIDPAPYVEGKF